MVPKRARPAFICMTNQIILIDTFKTITTRQFRPPVSAVNADLDAAMNATVDADMNAPYEYKGVNLALRQCTETNGQIVAALSIGISLLTPINKIS